MQAADSSLDLRIGVGYQQILTIALPISAAILVPQINFITNNIFLGHLNERSLAVAGLTGIFYMVFAVIGQGFGTGLQALISRKAGAGKNTEIGVLYQQAVLVVLLVSVLCMVATQTLMPSFLTWAMKDTANVAMATHFLRIRIMGLPFLYLYLISNGLLVGTNQSRFLIIGTATEACTNILLDYVLINGRLGFPQLGFTGAAYASVLAELAGCCAIFVVVFKNAVIRQLAIFKNWIFDKKIVQTVLVQSAPLVAQYAVSIISWEVFYLMVEHYGARELAISNAMRNIFGFFGCFTWAFASTCNNMVSNVIGQDLSYKVIELIHKIAKLSFCFSVVVCAVLNSFPHLFLAVYGQGNGFVNDAIPVLRVISTAMVLMSVATVWLNAVIGTGHTAINLSIEITSIVFYLIYVYVVMQKMHLPLHYAWASEWLYWAVMLVPSYWYMKSGKWKQ